LKISAIILAAGLSRRMGEEDKLFLPINGKPMIEVVIKNVTASLVDEVILVGNEKTIDRLSKYQNDGIRLVENLYYRAGMTSSIQVGIKEASGDAFMICLGDQPKISTSTYAQIIEAHHSKGLVEKQLITVPFYNGDKGNPVIFSSSYRNEILTHKEPEGCRKIIKNNSGFVQKIEVNDPGILIDVDTMDDYENL